MTQSNPVRIGYAVLAALQALFATAALADVVSITVIGVANGALAAIAVGLSVYQGNNNVPLANVVASTPNPNVAMPDMYAGGASSVDTGKEVKPSSSLAALISDPPPNRV